MNHLERERELIKSGQLDQLTSMADQRMDLLDSLKADMKGRSEAEGWIEQIQRSAKQNGILLAALKDEIELRLNQDRKSLHATRQYAQSAAITATETA